MCLARINPIRSLSFCLSFFMFGKLFVYIHVSGICGIWSLSIRSLCQFEIEVDGQIGFYPFYFSKLKKYIYIYIRQRISKYDQTASCPSNGIQFDWNFHENGFCWLVHILACDVNPIQNCSQNQIISMELRFYGIQKRDFPIYASTSKYNILIRNFH